MKTFVVFALVVVACVASTSALKCYSCVFPLDPKCEEAKGLDAKPCDDLGATEKLGFTNVCMKAVTETGGVKTITRSCTKKSGGADPCTLLKDNLDHCSICTEDMCNASAKMFINFWSTLIPIALAVFIKFF